MIRDAKTIEVGAPGAREKFEAWIARGDAVGVFENGDMSHSQYGHLLFAPLDPEDQERLPIGKAHANDGPHGLGWRYLLQSIEKTLGPFVFV